MTTWRSRSSTKTSPVVSTWPGASGEPSISRPSRSCMRTGGRIQFSLRATNLALPLGLMLGVLIPPSAWALAGQAAAEPPSRRTAVRLNELKHLRIEEVTDGTTTLRLTGTGEPTFNVYRLSDPERVVVDIAGSRPKGVVPRAIVDNWAVGRVRIDAVREQGVALSRVVVELKRDASYIIVPAGKDLLVTITPQAEPPARYFDEQSDAARKRALDRRRREAEASTRKAQLSARKADAQAKAADRKLARVAQEMRAIEASTRDAKQGAREADARVEAADRKLARVREQMREAEASTRAAKLSARQADAKAEAAGGQLAQARQQMREAESRRVAAEAQRARIEEEAKATREQARALLEHAKLVERQARAEHERAIEARSQAKRARRVATEQHRVSAAAKQDAELAKAREREALAEADAAQAKLTKLSRSRAKLHRTLERQSDESRALEASIGQRREQLAEVTQAVAAAQAKLDAQGQLVSKAAIKQAQVEVARAEARRAVLAKEVQRLEGEVAAKQSRRAQSEAELARRQRTLAIVEREVAAKRDEIERMQARRAELDQQGAALRQQNKATRAQLSTAKRKLTQLERAIARESKRLSTLNGKVHVAQGRLQGALAAQQLEPASRAAALVSPPPRQGGDPTGEAAPGRSTSIDATDGVQPGQLRESSTAASQPSSSRLAEAGDPASTAPNSTDSTAVASITDAAPHGPAAGGPSVRDVRFEDAQDESRVIVELDQAARYTLQDLSPWMKTLRIEGGELPSRLERSLDTSAYEGPVAMITTMRDGDDVKLVVTAQHGVSPRVEQKPGRLVWRFPRRHERGRSRAVSLAGSKVSAFASAAATTDPSSSRFLRGKDKWRGERIDVEFQDTSIKDILLLFSDIGRVNIIAGTGVQGTVTMRLKSVPWDQALDIILRSLSLGMVQEGNVIRVASIAALEEERKKAIERANAQVRLKPLETRLIPLSYATVNDMMDKVQSVLSSRGTVTPDSRTNTLIVMDVAENIALAEQLIDQLDGQTPQVVIEARIVEARTSWLRQLGIQWGFDYIASAGTGNPTGLLFPNSAGVAGGSGSGTGPTPGFILPHAAASPNYAVDLPAPVGTGAGGALGFSFGSISGNLNTNLRLSAAEDVGEVRIISAPQIVAMDNVQAQIEQGVQIPVSQVSAQGVNTRYVNATLALKVTPHVTNEGWVVLEVQVQKNEADFINTGARGDPTILTKQAQSRMLIPDGDTAVIGGINTRNTSINRKKVPWIADIPIIGWFFKNKSEADTRTEVLIFLTPKIVNRSTSIGG
ncbi:MAG: type IV pilus secretin PilQ [Myxococcales bacterium FL481]|nr:MAG: type IV pilus secretin PilQ [Myxococcales bacterium FL481]